MTVVSMPGIAVNPATAIPCSEVIDLCEDLLRRARAGELQSLGIAAVTSRGETFVRWEGQAPATDFLAAVTRLFLRVGVSDGELGS